MSMNDQDKHTRYQLVGWVLFVVCALLFLYVAVRDGDLLMSLASLVFLAGCIAFLIPLLFPGAAGKGGAMNERDGSSQKKR